MRRYSQSKDINRMVQDLVRDGWIPIRRKRHFQIINPFSGCRQTIPGSPGDWRSVVNFKHGINRMEG